MNSSNWNLSYDEVINKNIYSKVGMPTIHDHIKIEYDKIIINNNNNQDRIKYGDFYEIYFFIMRGQLLNLKQDLRDIKRKIRNNLNEIENIQDNIIKDLKIIINNFKNDIININEEITNELEIIVNNIIQDEIKPIKEELRLNDYKFRAIEIISNAVKIKKAKKELKEKKKLKEEINNMIILLNNFYK